MRRLLPCFCSILLVAACNTEQRELKQALRAAGSNRPELEAVLDHYRSDADSLKLRAAKYLIRYMPLHRSYGDEIERLYDRIDSMIPCYGDPDSLTAAIADEYLRVKSQISTHFDIQTVSSDYLIRNIEQAFDLWRNKPWAGLLDFEEFCEYLLPYKCYDMQPLTDWRSDWADRYDGKLGTHECVLWQDTPRIAASDVNTALQASKPYFYARPNPCPIFRASTVTNLPTGLCPETCIAAVQVMRSKGIPVCIDFTPNWAARSKNHYWMTVVNHRHQHEVFSAYGSNPGIPHCIDRAISKVFRVTYSPNPEVVRILKKDRWMPDALPCLFTRDVTETYLKTDDVSCRLYDDLDPDGTVYLAVFDDQNWIPVCWGARKGNTVCFERVGRDVLYMPIAYDERRSMYPVGEPFFLQNNGEMKYMHPDTLHRRVIRMNRKYPIYEYFTDIKPNLSGGVIEAATDPEFRNVRTILELPKDTLVFAGTEMIRCTDAFRYWRIRSTNGGLLDMAELHFYDGDQKLDAELFTTVVDEKSCSVVDQIDDDDALTYASLQDPNNSIWFDFHRPVNVSKIIWIRRGDGNDIYPGYDYTLYYWNNRNWMVIERQCAGLHTWIDFQNIPENALLYLACDTTGKQSRPFLYQNGIIVWY